MPSDVEAVIAALRTRLAEARGVGREGELGMDRNRLLLIGGAIVLA